ncbi:hypothetical protein E2C01_056625 [Portunus trituberculatus]|uniref:Uncharacterized protein n=1 Tax=Portunus trituberculatus TaxID=210409 RepID=A0A5B7GY71_PORTR|nr:hypothetical protein [Portunus trituberculatus]
MKVMEAEVRVELSVVVGEVEGTGMRKAVAVQVEVTVRASGFCW